MAENIWTISSLLQWTLEYLENKTGQKSRLDAELLLAHTLSTSRLKLYLNYQQPMSNDELSRFKMFLKRRVNGEPVQYIIGAQSFWTMDLFVGPGCLIPRPETECLIEHAIKLYNILDINTKNPRIADIGTGSGAIALAIATEIPGAKVIATDISADALSIAIKNAKKHDLDKNICFMVADLFKPISNKHCFDLVISNPPYVTTDEYEKLDIHIRDFEPQDALLAGIDGLDIYKQLIPQSFSFIASGGYLIVETGCNQAELVQGLFNMAGFTDICFGRDYSGLPRWVSGKKE